MKKLTLIVAVLALTISFSQCKKQDAPSIADGVRIMLTAGYGQNGAKTDFSPVTGSFVWTNSATEYIYVGGSNHDECLGVLSGTGTGTSSMNFDGTLTTTPDEGETLHFFYLGKGRNGSAVSTLDFSTQDGTLANVTNYHIAIGEGTYTSGTINYAITLNMAMAIAYFDLSGFVNSNSEAEIVYVHGENVYSTATVDYRAGTITGETKGYITAGTATAGTYMALIPSVSSTTPLKFDSGSKTGSMNFNRGIQAGKYYADSGTALSVTANDPMEGSLPGLFSVSETEIIRFSKGNLQYQASTNTWRFAENQWDYVGQDNANISQTYDGWIDLFGWGTSGYNHGAVCYQPWSTSETCSDYYAYGGSSRNLYDQTGQADWGCNAISNGGNTENIGWRTLTSEEWYYVLRSRDGICFARATVNGQAGLIILPDGWSDGTYALNSTNTFEGASYTSNQISGSVWMSTLEPNGAVFLPAAGYRIGTTASSDGSYGHYWSAEHYRSDEACRLYFSDVVIYPRFSYYRYLGFSVRLAKDEFSHEISLYP